MFYYLKTLLKQWHVYRSYLKIRIFQIYNERHRSHAVRKPSFYTAFKERIAIRFLKILIAQTKHLSCQFATSSAISICVYLTCLITLHACSLFKPIQIEPLHYYTITAYPRACPTQCSRSTILVTQPRANAMYNSPRMIYSPDCYQLQFFTKNRWADTPPQMLHPLLIKSLQNTGYFQAIINTPTTTRYDWILNTQLLSFQQEFLTAASRFRLGIRAQLINTHSNCIIATQDFMVVQKTPMDNPHGGAIAANIATQKMLRKIDNFCLDWTL